MNCSKRTAQCQQDSDKVTARYSDINMKVQQDGRQLTAKPGSGKVQQDFRWPLFLMCWLLWLWFALLLSVVGPALVIFGLNLT